jgi:hypothetical protein
MRFYDTQLVSWSEFPDDEILIQLEPHSHIAYVRPFRLHHDILWVHVTALNMNVWSFKWQCPTNRHVTCLNWFLFSTTTSPVLLVWGCWEKHIFLSQCGLPVLLDFMFIQFVMVHFVTFWDVTGQFKSCKWMFRMSLSQSVIYSFQFPRILAPISVTLCHVVSQSHKELISVQLIW